MGCRLGNGDTPPLAWGPLLHGDIHPAPSCLCWLCCAPVYSRQSRNGAPAGPSQGMQGFEGHPQPNCPHPCPVPPPGAWLCDTAAALALAMTFGTTLSESLLGLGTGSAAVLGASRR